MHDDSKQPVAWRYQTPTGWHATTDAQKAVSLRAHHPVEPLYAAPQASEAAPFSPDWANYRQGVADGKAEASEAVRNAALEEAAQAVEARIGFGEPGVDTSEPDAETRHCANVIRALKTQADKDGGDCAKGAGDGDGPNAEAWLIEWQPGDGNTWVEADANEVRAREKAKRMGGTATPMVRAALPTPSVVKQSLTATQHPRTDGGGRG